MCVHPLSRALPRWLLLHTRLHSQRPAAPPSPGLPPNPQRPASACSCSCAPTATRIVILGRRLKGSLPPTSQPTLCLRVVEMRQSHRQTQDTPERAQLSPGPPLPPGTGQTSTALIQLLYLSNQFNYYHKEIAETVLHWTDSACFCKSKQEPSKAKELHERANNPH